MRVVLYEPNGGGGIFHYTFELAEALSKSGIEVTVLTRSDHELSDLRRSFVIRGQLEESLVKRFLHRARSRIVRGQPRSPKPQSTGATNRQSPTGVAKSETRAALRRLVLRAELVASLLLERPHIIHLQWLSDPDRDYKLVRLLKLLGFKIVYTAHNVLPHGGPKHDLDAFQNIHDLMDAIIVHAESNKRELSETLTVDPGKVFVIPHGAYGLFYREKKTSKEEARQLLQLPPDKKVLLLFGSVRRYKGLEYLAPAFRLVRQRVPNVTLLIVGDVQGEDPEELEFNSKLIAEIEHEEGIVFRRGYVDFEKVGDYFTAADVIMLPYIKTYQSGVLLLACMAGRPVVATDTGGLAEVVEAGKSGLIVPPRDVESLAEATVTLVADPQKTDEMGRYARYLAETKYSWEASARKTVEVYRHVRGLNSSDGSLRRQSEAG